MPSYSGAECLVDTLAQSGISVCFANPGTSEIHLVRALGQRNSIRPVLGLFEGVATGAADGYARMTDKPAAVLLHLGPGLANGTGNLLNARRANSPMVVLVGDHPAAHLKNDPPLATRLDVLADYASGWVGRPATVDEMPALAQTAVEQATNGPGRIATLLLASDLTWNESAPAAGRARAVARLPAGQAAIAETAQRLKQQGARTALLLGGRALRAEALGIAGRIAAATGCKLLAPTHPGRIARGAGTVPVERLVYYPPVTHKILQQFSSVTRLGAPRPAAFFAYKDQPWDLIPESCTDIELASDANDLMETLRLLAEAVGATAKTIPVAERMTRPAPLGVLTPETVAATVSRHMPTGAIVCEEAVTSSLPLPEATATAAAHEWLCLTGGALGQCVPSAIGAAVAAPDRKVICLVGDGSLAYTVQALWTAARENLDIVTVVYANRAYAVLENELNAIGVTEPNAAVTSTFALDRPEMNFAMIAQGFGVRSARTDDAAEFDRLFADAMQKRGPVLIEAVLPRRR
jgi:acetolactate synthase-1/2/3 large subunit